jgi:cell wall-associated NlpC family hydrolase
VTPAGVLVVTHGEEATMPRPRRRRLPGRVPVRRAALVLAFALVPGLLTVPAVRADHRRGPSAEEVAAGQAAVAQREAQVRRAAARVAAEKARFAGLVRAAEVAVESYNAARVRQQEAEDAAAAARLVLQTADERLGDERRRAGAFAAAAYMGGGLAQIDMVLTADGPEGLFYRLGTLEALSRSERDVVQSFEAAQVFQRTVEQETAATLDRARSAARTADAARSKAEAAVGRQSAVLTELREQQRRLAALLDDARAHASALERERLAAIARARAAAARRGAAKEAAAQQPEPVPAPPPGGASGEVPGTVSAETGQQAVTYAESQIGKPYEWGADGPDSYDCSGLTMWAYAQVGVHLDHWTGYQWEQGEHISTAAMRPGDLAFFASDTSDPSTIHHVGMYIGNGQMVEAPYTGANVRISSVWRPDLIGVVRPYQR